jgi:hypothetical protein
MCYTKSPLSVPISWFRNREKDQGMCCSLSLSNLKCLSTSLQDLLHDVQASIRGRTTRHTSAVGDLRRWALTRRACWGYEEERRFVSKGKRRKREKVGKLIIICPPPLEPKISVSTLASTCISSPSTLSPPKIERRAQSSKAELRS